MDMYWSPRASKPKGSQCKDKEYFYSNYSYNVYRDPCLLAQV